MTLLRRINIAIVVVLAAGAAAAWLWLKPRLDVGTGYAAKQICSCIYLGQRDFEDCRADLFDDPGPIDLRWVPEREGVEAWVLLLSDAAAYYHRGTGCTLER